jgi:hypothetical protein
MAVISAPCSLKGHLEHELAARRSTYRLSRVRMRQDFRRRAAGERL